MQNSLGRCFPNNNNEDLQSVREEKSILLLCFCSLHFFRKWIKTLGNQPLVMSQQAQTPPPGKQQQLDVASTL